MVGFRACGLYPGSEPRWFYLAMEYVRGRTLQQWVDEENPGARRVAELLRGMARGLAATHAASVLHRDIKEHNVVVREEDGEAVLVDFGVGDYPGAPRLTRGVLPPGTERYRSPEALAFRLASSLSSGARYVPTPSDDVYALGVVVYWMLTGRHPFTDVETPSEVAQLISQAPEAPHVANPRVPSVLSGLCMRLLSKQPEERATAKALCAAVEEALSGADAGWEVPLCEEHPAVPAPPLEWPEDDAEALELWFEVGAGGGHPPRRGRRPGPPAPAPEPARGLEVAPAPLPHARPAMGPGARVPPVRAGIPRVGGALVGVGVFLAGALLLAGTWRTGLPPKDSRREVASAGAPPESGPASMPSPAAPTAAATAPLAVSAQKEDMPLKTLDPVPPAAPPGASRPRGALARTLVTAAACTALACPGGPQVRPPPDPEACPEGAVEAMKALGIRMGRRGLVFFGGMEPYVTVREGPVRVQVENVLGGLAHGHVRGRLFVRGDRVYARFTEATVEGGKTVPVCLSMVDPRTGANGVVREDRGGDSDSARILVGPDAMAVPGFE